MDPKRHNYYKKIMKLSKEGQLPSAAVSEVEVAHDDWCASYAGGYCDCDPEIKVRTLAKETGTSKRHSTSSEETRPLERPSGPCPHCGSVQFIIWQKADDPTRKAVSCNGCGAVMSSTHPLDPDDRPKRRQ